MLLEVREATPGQQYVTSKGRVPVTLRGPAPKLKATDNPMWILAYTDSSRTVEVPGSYMLETPDTDSPLLGTAPRIDAFALNTVAWGRERVPRLSDADLELLAEIDTRPGIRTAISAEVVRRGEARAKVAPVVVEPVGICPYDGEPIYDLAAHAEAHAAADRQEYRNADCLALSRQPDPPFPPVDVAADDDFEAPVFGDLPVAAGEPLTPADDGVASAFPETMPELEPALAEVVVDAPTVAEVVALADPGPDGPPLDGLEDVFGDRPAEPLVCAWCPDPKSPTPASHPNGAEHVPAEPTPRTGHHTWADAAHRELGADFVNVAHDFAAADFGTVTTNTYTLTVRNPTDGTNRSFEAPTLNAAIIAAREWLATMRAPVEPRRKRRVSPPPVSPPSPDVEALTRRIAELETGAKDYCGLMEDFDKSRAINLELEAKLEDVAADRDDVRGALDRMNAHAAKMEAALSHIAAMTGTTYAAILSDEGVGVVNMIGGLKNDLRRERAPKLHDDLVDAMTFGVDHASKADRIFYAMRQPVAAPFPTNLSQAGADRARKVQAALRALADTVPWTIAAGEAEAALRELGRPGFGS